MFIGRATALSLPGNTTGVMINKNRTLPYKILVQSLMAIGSSQ